jgi:hypothetical protein
MDSQERSFKVDSRGRRIYTIEEWFPQHQDFIAEIPSLISKLPQVLNIPSTKLDMSESSLLQINRAICRKGKIECEIPDIVQMLTAYLGEMLRQAVNGQWEMRSVTHSREGEIKFPWVIAPNGHTSPVPSLIFKELTEGKSCHLDSHFRVQLIDLTSPTDSTVPMRELTSIQFRFHTEEIVE